MSPDAILTPLRSSCGHSALCGYAARPGKQLNKLNARNREVAKTAPAASGHCARLGPRDAPGQSQALQKRQNGPGGVGDDFGEKVNLMTRRGSHSVMAPRGEQPIVLPRRPAEHKIC